MFLSHLACSLAPHPMRSQHTTLRTVAASSILPPAPSSSPPLGASSFPTLESILPPHEFLDARLLCLELDDAPRSCYCCDRSSTNYGAILFVKRLNPSDDQEAIEHGGARVSN